MDEPVKPFVFSGYPVYLDRVSEGKPEEVCRLTRGLSSILDTADLLSQAAEKKTERSHRLAILESAKLRCEAAHLAAACCQAMVDDVEANIDAPAPDAAVDSPKPGTPDLYRTAGPAKPSVISNTNEPTSAGAPVHQTESSPEAQTLPVIVNDDTSKDSIPENPPKKRRNRT